MSPRKDVAIIGAAGSCGRQLAMQLLSRQALPPYARLQLVARRGGKSEVEILGLKTDLRDAFADTAPHIELIDRPELIDADILVMLAGSTVPSDPTLNVDRRVLARKNLEIFRTFAEELGKRNGTPPLVIVQSNPVELGVEVFSRHIDRHHVIGAGANSDTMRFSREVADSLGVRSSDVTAFMLGQHGDNLIPIWSKLAAKGVDSSTLSSWIAEQRSGRSLESLPDEIVRYRSELLHDVASSQAHEAFARAALLPADLRAAVKPFLVHTTAGRTTEIVTAHAVAEIIETIVNGRPSVFPLQVRLEGEYLGLNGTGAVPVQLTPEGWTRVVDMDLADDEVTALHRSFGAIASISASVEADETAD